MLLRGKHGWPIERVKGRWFFNLVRLLFHIDLWGTWRRRKEPWWRCAVCSGIYRRERRHCICGGALRLRGKR